MSYENFLPGNDDKINQLLQFTALVDKMTAIERRTLLVDGRRRENDAEHSWHIALMCMLFKDYAPEGTDIAKAVQMCIVHDLVEIYAGDTFAYDVQANVDKEKREEEAADKLFSQLPVDLCKKIRDLWDEFEQWETPEAKFAHTLDNFQPLMLQHASKGRAWKEGGRKLTEVLARNAKSAEGSAALWEYAREKFIQPEIDSGNLIDNKVG